MSRPDDQDKQYASRIRTLSSDEYALFHRRRRRFGAQWETDDILAKIEAAREDQQLGQRAYSACMKFEGMTKTGAGECVDNWGPEFVLDFCSRQPVAGEVG